MRFASATVFAVLISLKIISAGSGGYTIAAESSKNPGAATSHAQGLLAALGYDPGPADGKLGPRTREAIKSFEQDLSRKTTGEANAKLVERLQKWVQLSAIMELYLKAMGYEVGSIDGVLEKKSRSAISSFQKSHKLSLTERLSPNLFNAIWLQARKQPDATKFLCKHYSSNNSVSRSLSWCKQAAKFGDDKAGTIVTQLQHRISNQPKLAPSRRLFRKDRHTKREKKALGASLEASKKAIEGLGLLQLWFTFEQLKKGNCKRLEEIDDKATKGSAKYQHILSDLYHQGLCVEKNDTTAVKWLKLAADQGYASAQFDLAIYYQKGRGIKKNIAEAVRWHKAAGNQGDTRAQYTLGEIFEDGQGVIQDYAAARRWYEMAANQGHNKSIVSLGYIYLKGKGVKKDPAEAFRWFEKSAQQGFKAGQVLAAIMLSDGLGTSRNLVEAHKWANLASTSDNSKIAKMAVSARSKAEKLMKPQQIFTAQKLAKSWKPKSLRYKAPLKRQPAELPSISAEMADQLSQEEAKAKLLALGVPINKDTLRKIVKIDKLGLFKLFHKAGADLNTGLGTYRDMTPLYLSIDWGARNIYRYLMDNAVDINKRSWDNGMTPLVRSISWGRWDIVNELLDAGADASQSQISRPEKRGALFAGNALEYAVSFASNPVLIFRLLQAGANVDERYFYGATPLHRAVGDGYIENVRVLLRASANPNAANQFGITPILKIIAGKKPPKVELIKLLIESGASVKQKSRSTPSPLFWVVYRGRADLINLFVQSGADVNERYYFTDGKTPTIISDDPTLKEVTQLGGTPLHVAAKLGHLSAAKALLKSGANQSVVLKVGAKIHSVASLAKLSGNTTLFNFLKTR